MRLFTSKLAAGLLALTAAAAAHGQIYKWVDANGRTHYSSSQEGAGTRKVDEVRAQVQAQPKSPAAVEPAWKKQEEEFRRRQAEQAKARKPAAPPSRPQTVNGVPSGQSETDASRCQLGRDILADRVRRGGWKQADADDRRMAQQDVDNFCKK